MKLHESLRKIIRQFGINVLQEKRLMSLLADYKSFDDYPAMKDVMKAVADEGHGKELCRLAMDGSDSDFRSYADDVRKSLMRNGHFKESLAAYAVDSISFALGFKAAVNEPSEHGFNALDSSNVAAPEETSVSEPSDAESLWNLGEKYYQGLECKKDYFKAAGYYRKALALLMKKETGREAGTGPVLRLSGSIRSLPNMEVPMPSTVSGLCTSTDWVFPGTIPRQKNGSGRLRPRGTQLPEMRLRQ